MVADLAGDEDLEPAVQIERTPSPAWIRAAAEAYGGDKADRDILGMIVGRIREETAFATLVLDDRPVAWGLGVAERGFLGLYDIVVAPDLRGLGLGRQVVAPSWPGDARGERDGPISRCARPTRWPARSTPPSASPTPTATPTGCR
jgi:GNAT superfamily N-acetyltransferase